MVLNAGTELRWNLAGGPRGRAEKLQPGSYCAAIWKFPDCDTHISFPLCLFCSALCVLNHRQLEASPRQPEAPANSRVYKLFFFSRIKANTVRRGLSAPDVSVQHISSTNMCVPSEANQFGELSEDKQRAVRACGMPWGGLQRDGSCYVGDQTFLWMYCSERHATWLST